MFTIAFVSAVAIAASVVAVVKVKQVVDIASCSMPSQCLLEGMHD